MITNASKPTLSKFSASHRIVFIWKINASRIKIKMIIIPLNRFHALVFLIQSKM